MKKRSYAILLIMVLFLSISNSRHKKTNKKIKSLEVISNVKVKIINITDNDVEIGGYYNFREAVGMRESSNRYHIVNSLGYLGKYQFGVSTLSRFDITNIDEFLKDEELQDNAFYAHCQINKYSLRKYISKYVGKVVGGVLITESGILAAAHLGGAGGVRKFLRSDGRVNKGDRYGTSVGDYINEFGSHNVDSVVPKRRVSLKPKL